MNKIFTIYLLLIFSFGIISCADNDSSSANSKLGNVLDQPNSTDEMLRHQGLQITAPLPNSGRIWKRDRKSLEVNDTSNLWSEWSKIEAPTLILRGRQSNILKQDVAIKMRESIPTARLVELEGAGHWLYQEIASAFEDVVRWFLQNP